MHDVNILGSANIARVAIDKKIKGVIGISTDKASPPVKNIMNKSSNGKIVYFYNNHKTKLPASMEMLHGRQVQSAIWSKMFKKIRQY